MKKTSPSDAVSSAKRHSSLRLTLWLTQVATLVMATMFTAACSQKPELAGERFLYVIDCEARVDKLDTVEGTKLASIALAERSPLVPKVQSAQSGLDGCIAESVLKDATGNLVNVIVPTTTRVDSEGKRDFQWLTFALPDWTFVSAKPAGAGLEQPPFLQREGGGAVSVALAESRNTPPELNWRDYKNTAAVLATTILQSSGDTSLLSVFTTDKSRFTVGLANQRTRVLTLLADLPSTTVTNVHLAPGGDYVLAEITEPNSSPINRTGALRLYDATGKSVADVRDEAIRNSAFVALTPNGSAVYRSGSEYRFIMIAPKGTRFGNAAVTQSSLELQPGLVFAAQ